MRGKFCTMFERWNSQTEGKESSAFNVCVWRRVRASEYQKAMSTSWRSSAKRSWTGELGENRLEKSLICHSHQFDPKGNAQNPGKTHVGCGMFPRL